MNVTLADGRAPVSAQCHRGEAYSLSYVELLSDTRTKLEDFLNILLVRRFSARITHLSKILLAKNG
jgi:hypothetical protein